MKNLISFLLISIVGFIAVFGGFLITIHMASDSHIDCPVGAVTGNKCISGMTAFDSAAAHIGLLLRPMILPLLVIALLTFSILIGVLTVRIETISSALIKLISVSAIGLQVFLEKLRFWIILHEKKAPSSALAMTG